MAFSKLNLQSLSSFQPLDLSVHAEAPTPAQTSVVDTIKGTASNLATMSGIPQQFEAGISQIQQPFKDKAAAGGGGVGQVKAIEGALNVGAGVVTAITSPFAPIVNLINKGVQAAGDALAETPYMKEYGKAVANLPYEQSNNPERILTAIMNATIIGGAVAGGVGSLKPKAVLEMAEVPKVTPETPKLTVTEPVVTPKPTITPGVVGEGFTPLESVGNRVIPKPSEEAIPSKVGVSVAQTAIEKGLTEKFEGTAGYDPITVKAQAKLVGDLIDSDPQRAISMMSGDTPIPYEIRSSALLTGLEDYATRRGDGALLKELAQSPLASETSIHAQEMRLLAERSPESPVTLIKEITKARETAATKVSGSLSKARKSITTDIKSEIRKGSTKQTWGEFVKSIEC